MKFQTQNPVLIILDVQKAIDHPSWGVRNNLYAEQRIANLLHVWRQNALPIIHVRHASVEVDSTYRPNQEGYEFKPEVMPKADEEIITKNVNCAFIGTSLNDSLRTKEAHEIIVCGVVTNNSVDATVRVASNLGYRVFIPNDATATFGMTTREGKFFSAEDIHSIFLTNLHGEYAEIVKTKDILAALVT
jgi:nicotinamidase-related amidase